MSIAKRIMASAAALTLFVCLNPDALAAPATSPASTASLPQTDAPTFERHAASLAAENKCREKLSSSFGNPPSLLHEDKLDNSIKVARNAFLEYTKTLETIYHSDTPSSTSLYADLSCLKTFNEIVNTLEQRKYGIGFTDHEIMNAHRHLLPMIGKLMSNETEKELEYVILQSRKQMSEQELVAEMDFSHWSKKDWDDFEDYLAMERDYAEQLKLTDPFNIPVIIEAIKGDIRALDKYYPDNHPLKLEYEIKLAKLFSASGDANNALSLTKALLPKVQSVFGRNSDRAIFLTDLLCMEYGTLGKYKEAEKLLVDNIAVKSNLYGEADARTLKCENDLVRIYWKLGKYREAKTLLDSIEMSAINDLQPDNPARISILLSRCMALEDMRLFAESNKLFRLIPELPQFSAEKVRTLSRLTSGQNVFGYTLQDNLNLLGIDSAYHGDFHYRTIEDVSRIALDYIKIGRFAEAESLATSALASSSHQYGPSAPCTINAMLTLSQAKRALGEYEKALQMDEATLKISHDSQGKDSPTTLDALTATADDYLGIGKYDVAIKKYKKAMDLAKNFSRLGHEKPWRLMAKLANAYCVSGNYQDAISLCEEIKQNRFHFEPRLYTEDISVLLTLAHAYQAAGNPEAAINNYESIIHALESVRENSLLDGESLSIWFSSAVDTYKELAAAYLSSKRQPLSILEIVDLAKARNLADRYREETSIYTGGLSYEDILRHTEYLTLLETHDKAKREATDNQLMKLSLDISRLKQLLNIRTFRRELSEKYPEYKRKRFTPPLGSGNINEKTMAIPKDALFIDYTILNGDIILVNVSRHNSADLAIAVSVGEDFWGKCQLYHDLLAISSVKILDNSGLILWRFPDFNYTLSSDDSPADKGAIPMDDAGLEDARKRLALEIGDKLLTPISNQLSTSKWIISPDGELANLPFETLVFNGKSVLETADVSYVPSLSVMKLMRDREAYNKLTERRDLFAIGGVPYGNHTPDECNKSLATFFENPSISNLPRIKWRNLASSAREIDAVSEMFSTREVFLGSTASESNLKTLDENGDLKQYRYLLFSAHGIYLQNMPELSSIVLCRDAKADGYVTVGEWAGYNLASDLVYLSACESGLGKYQPGEGIMGIPYSLTLAGNQNTVMTVWSVDDKKTADFTKAFFDKICHGIPQVRALSLTKKEFVEKGEKPFAWAPFLLYGI